MKCITKKELIKFEEDIATLFKNGCINCPVHLSSGNEEQLIKIFEDIKECDYVLSTHRNHYHYLLKGGNKEKLLNEILGNKLGVCGGKGRSMHIYDTNINFYTSAIVGGICAIACGIGLSIKYDYKNRKRFPHVWVFVGDGAEDTGFFIEAVRFTNSRRLPITFVIEDNDLAVESTKKNRWHNFSPVNMPNIIRYNYIRLYPHVGIKERIAL